MGVTGSKHEARRPTWALPALLLALLAGCPATNSKPCAADAECAPGVCRRGACAPECVEDLQCAAGTRCIDQKCVVPPECLADGDCATGFSCALGRCVCHADSACAVNEACLQGACAPRPGCTAEADCAPLGRHCEPTQGLCLNPCGEASDCAPGSNAQLASLLYQCVSGFCQRRCTTTAQCGPGITCIRGGCTEATCKTLADCAAGEYCTSATSGQCLPRLACTASTQCPAGQGCRVFATSACPPGLDCSQDYCQDNPPCGVDRDCSQLAGPTYCSRGRCTDAAPCPDGVCGAGELCVAAVCYPSGCRGLNDCPAGQACEAGQCALPPPASAVMRLVITPGAATMRVGDTAAFSVLGFRSDGSSFPVAATFAIATPGGAPSALASVDSSGTVTALSAGDAVVRANLAGSPAPSVQAALSIHGAVASGRRVTVVDAITRLPLPGVVVAGCDGPPSDAACPAPAQMTTDARGEAVFPFTQPLASFLAVSPETRADGLPRFDEVGVAAVASADVLLPLTANPVHQTAGAVVTLSFSQVHSAGALSVGFAVASAGDPSELDLRTYLGETFQVSLPGSTQRLPLPGSAEVLADLGLGFPVPVKPHANVLAQGGRRHLATFAGRFDLASASSLGGGDLLGQTSAMDFGQLGFQLLPPLPRVVDATDVDGDGLCADAQKCPAGPEEVPDYGAFPQLTQSPALPQATRTELVLPPLPVGLDTAVVSIVARAGEPGLLPLGLSSQAPFLVAPDGTRPLANMVVRSGEPASGVELGARGLWLVGVQTRGRGLTAATATASARLVLGPTLPARLVAPPLLPVLENTVLTSATRTVGPGQPAWNEATSLGANLARVTLTGARTRQVVYVAADGSQSAIRLPEPPPGSADPASEPAVGFQLTALEVDVSAEELFDLGGANLTTLLEHLSAYSRFQAE